MDLNELTRLASQLQSQLAQTQDQAQSLRVTGEAGGGMARVVLNGKYEVVELDIDAKAFEGGDKALVEDLIRAAFNQASARVGEDVRQRMGSFAESMGIDLSALGLGK
jgi:DNA-binding YbaB/EbfC family protein